jgi:hypothetical protein
VFADSVPQATPRLGLPVDLVGAGLDQWNEVAPIAIVSCGFSNPRSRKEWMPSR